MEERSVWAGPHRAVVPGAGEGRKCCLSGLKNGFLDLCTRVLPNALSNSQDTGQNIFSQIITEILTITGNFKLISLSIFR